MPVPEPLCIEGVGQARLRSLAQPDHPRPGEGAQRSLRRPLGKPEPAGGRPVEWFSPGEQADGLALSRLEPVVGGLELGLALAERAIKRRRPSFLARSLTRSRLPPYVMGEVGRPLRMAGGQREERRQRRPDPAVGGAELRLDECAQFRSGQRPEAELLRLPEERCRPLPEDGGEK